MKKILIAAAALSALATSAFAADLPARMPVKAAPMVPVQNWTGCYIGAGGGYGLWNQDHRTIDAAGVPVAPGFQTTTGGRGWFGTAQFGCDYQFDQNWLVGAFIDGNWGSLRGDFEDASFAGWGRERERWSWAGGGRVGYLIYPQLLGFVSAGYEAARFDQINLSAGGAVTNIYPRHTYSGYFIGTGYEYKLTWLPGLTWKTEVRFADMGRDNLPLLTAAGLPTGFSMNSHKYEQTVRSELVWRFNWWR
jgi:outer membrane immunogenic protein